MCQIKAPIAVNSKAIAKIGNAELAHFNKQMLIHELIRGSPGLQIPGRPFSEEKLFQYAYAYEQATQHRKSPLLFP
jgi:hypothetical protein